MRVVAASKGGIASSPSWPRYASVVIAALIVGVTLSPLWWKVGESGMELGVVDACVRWDDLAREAIARQVRDGKRDADLRQVGDAIFQLRRARRNCQAGWIRLACQDYLAVSRTAVVQATGEPGCAVANAEIAGTAR
jgi:hypothetical protein